ncbi:MAG: InlB B-repeat-containing protein, partial [Clostridiales Family XIII bacterium]|nr:InlB B-repeat-containing protein [Clostridiales Family XIII bacterium]
MDKNFTGFGSTVIAKRWKVAVSYVLVALMIAGLSPTNMIYARDAAVTGVETISDFASQDGGDVVRDEVFTEDADSSSQDEESSVSNGDTITQDEENASQDVDFIGDADLNNRGEEFDSQNTEPDADLILQDEALDSQNEILESIDENLDIQEENFSTQDADFVIEFYTDISGTEIFDIQMVPGGGFASEPAGIPDIPDSSGLVSFMGWYENGKPDDAPFDFYIPIAEDKKLYARFSDKYLVQYTDPDERVFLSKRVAPGGSIPLLDAEEMILLNAPIGKVLDYWRLFESTVPYDMTSPVNSDLKFAPVLVDSIYVYFVTEGSDVEPIAVKRGSSLASALSDLGMTEVPEPVRSGYAFEHWTTAHDGQGSEYDQNLPLTEALTLFANWSLVPNGAQYKVIYWLEKPDFPVGSDPTPGNSGDYVYADERIEWGTIGDLIEITEIPSYTEYASSHAMRYAEFQSSTPIHIAEIGETVVNVYAKRKVYDLVFIVNPIVPGYPRNNQYMKLPMLTGETIMYAGVPYTGQNPFNYPPYVLSVKYGQTITDTWPTAPNAIFEGFAGPQFYAWVPGDELNGGGDWVTRRVVVSEDMMPKDPTSAGGIFTSERGPMPGAPVRHLRYWVECLPAQVDDASVTKREYGGKTYALDESYSQDIPGADVLNGKIISGLNHVGTNASAELTGAPLTDSVPGGSYRHHYYDRNLSTLVFDALGGTEVAPASGVKFGMPLGGFEPNNEMLKSGYDFDGWYADSYTTIPFDFDAEIMPDHDVAVYAKWNPRDYKVTFRDEEGVPLGYAPLVKTGELVDLYNVTIDGVVYNNELQLPNKGQFDGWRYYPVGSRLRALYPNGKPVFSDFDLYVSWKTDAFTISYTSVGAVSGEPPWDPSRYRLGVDARVMGSNTLVGNTEFVGWKLDRTGVIYYPNSLISVTGDLILNPRFESGVNPVSITLHDNLEGSDKVVTIHGEKGETVRLPYLVPEFVNTGFRIGGWGESPDSTRGAIGFYDLDDDYPVNEDADLYAIWIPDMARIVFRANPGGVLEAPDGSGNTDTVIIYVDRETLWSDVTFPKTVVTVPGYMFTGWRPAKPAGSTTVSQDSVFTANFAPYHMVKFTINSYYGSLEGETEFQVPTGERMGNYVTPPEVIPDEEIFVFNRWEPDYLEDAVVDENITFSAVMGTYKLVPNDTVVAYDGVYDGNAHMVTINNTATPPFTVEYKLGIYEPSDSYPWSSDPIPFYRTELGWTDLYVRISHPEYITRIFDTHINITKPNLLELTAESITVEYDGMPHMIKPAEVNTSGAVLTYIVGDERYTDTLPPGWIDVGYYDVIVEATHELYATVTANAIVTILPFDGGGGATTDSGITAYSLTYTSEGAVSGTAPLDNNRYRAGAQVRVLGGGSLVGSADTVFVGWRVDGEGSTYYPGSLISVTRDLTLVPQFVQAASAVNITLHDNYGDSSAEFIMKAAPNSSVKLPSVVPGFVHEGLRIIGWNEAAGAIIDGVRFYELSEDYSVGGTDKSIYAIWDQDKARVIFRAGEHGTFEDGGGTTAVVVEYVGRGTSWSDVTTPNAVGEPGYAFSGWSPEFPTTGNVNYDAEFWADFELSFIPYTVTYTKGEATNGEPPVDSKKYRLGESAQVLGRGSLVAPSGTEFVGWRIDGAGSVYTEGSYIAVSGNLTMVPYFAMEGSLVEVSLYDNVPGSSNPPLVIKATAGSEIILPSAVDGFVYDGHRLVGWGTAATTIEGGTGYYDLDAAYPVSGDADLYAVWKELTEDRVRISFRAGDNGYIDSGADLVKSVVIYVESGVLWSAIEKPELAADTGYVFDEWIPEIPTSGAVYNAGFVAQFKPDETYNFYSVTYEAGEGTGTVPVDARLYRAGEQAKVLGGSGLTAAGKVFAGWKIDGAGSVYTEGSYVTVNEDLTLIAYFVDENEAVDIT